MPPPPTADAGGRFVRQPAQYRNWVTADGTAGPSGAGGFAAAPDRYHLYVSYACPWAHRTLILRALKGLERLIPISVVHWRMGPEGWSFQPGPGVIEDPLHAADFLSQVYRADPHPFDGHATTPLLWDQGQRRIVNNESADILRMFNSAFDAVGAKSGDYYPKPLRAEIDALAGPLYERLNNGVYRAGFARSQAAYEEAARGVFAQLDELETRLAKQRYLCGGRFTEADVRLFVTLIRFDAAYHGHFKCNLRRLRDYPVLSAYTRDVYQMPAIRGTVQLEHIKRHYYESHPALDPTGIVPVGPELDFDSPHGRAGLSPA
ncbi:MAG: glutathione S-transferase family protein [Deltaproteobacteria bacterium]